MTLASDEESIEDIDNKVRQEKILDTNILCSSEQRHLSSDKNNDIKVDRQEHCRREKSVRESALELTLDKLGTTQLQR